MEPYKNTNIQHFHGIEEVRRNWIWFLLLGIALILLGIAAISSSVTTTLFSVFFLGYILAIGGVLQVIYSFWARRWSGFFLSILAGILYTVIGFMLIRNPAAGALTLTLLLAAFYTVAGLFRIIGAITTRFHGWEWVLFSGIVSLILGILIYEGWPSTGLWVIGLFIGIDLLFLGWSWVVLSLSAKNQTV